MKQKCKRMFSVDSQKFFHQKSNSTSYQRPSFKIWLSAKKAKEPLKPPTRLLSSQMNSLRWSKKLLEGQKDERSFRRRRESTKTGIAKGIFYLLATWLWKWKKLFFCKNEKNNFFVYFLYFLFHFHRIPMTCCQNVLIAAETKFCQKMKNQSCSSRADFFLIWALFVIWFSFLCWLLHYKWLV